MDAFSFYKPTKILFGQGQIQPLGSALAAADVRHCLLIAGKASIRSNGVYDQVIASLGQAKIKITEAWGVEPNPSLAKVREIISLAKAEQVDAVLGVGGSSVLDTAKAVAAGYYLNDVWDAFTGQEVVQRALPIYTVLTLSATGSEMNATAVITNNAMQQKWALYSPHIYPQISIVDPSVQSSLPFRQTASGAMNTIAQILEYSFSDNKAIATLATNAALLKVIVELTDRLQKNAADYEARANLAWAAIMALSAMSGSACAVGNWSCHGIEHAISALNPKITHGEGLAAVFPAWIGFVSDREHLRFASWAKDVWGEESVAHALHKFREKLEQWGMPGSLRDLGLKDTDLPLLTKLILSAPHRCTSAVFDLDEEDLEALLMLAF